MIDRSITSISEQTSQMYSYVAIEQPFIDQADRFFCADRALKMLDVMRQVIYRDANEMYRQSLADLAVIVQRRHGCSLASSRSGVGCIDRPTMSADCDASSACSWQLQLVSSPLRNN